MKKHRDIEKILLGPREIERGVRRLARKISRDYAGKDLMLVSILKGSVVFLSDLIRFLTVPCTVDFMSVASYGGSTESSGVVRLLMDLRQSPQGRDVLVVEDILDTGLTMHYLLDNLRTRKPRSLRICSLLEKTSNRRTNVRPDYAGFKIPDAFVVGYGLDYAERYRHLPYVGILKKEIVAGGRKKKAKPQL